jgi:hypothetical protein
MRCARATAARVQAATTRARGGGQPPRVVDRRGSCGRLGVMERHRPRERGAHHSAKTARARGREGGAWAVSMRMAACNHAQARMHCMHAAASACAAALAVDRPVLLGGAGPASARASCHSPRARPHPVTDVRALEVLLQAHAAEMDRRGVRGRACCVSGVLHHASERLSLALGFESAAPRRLWRADGTALVAPSSPLRQH